MAMHMQQTISSVYTCFACRTPFSNHAYLFPFYCRLVPHDHDVASAMADAFYSTVPILYKSINRCTSFGSRTKYDGSISVDL